MAVKKKTVDPTAKNRVASLEQRKRDAGLVAVNLKVWVRKEVEQEARVLLREAKNKAEDL